MDSLYKNQLTVTDGLSTESEKLTYSTSILRSLLQTLAIVSFEAVDKLLPFTPSNIQLDSLLHRFEQPSDGLPIEALDALIPIIRGYISKNYMHGWFEKTDQNNPSLVQDLQAWVEFRNKRQGHGVLCKGDIETWSKLTLDIIKKCLNISGQSLPKIGTSGKYESSIGDSLLIIDTPLSHQESPLVISKVIGRKGVWKLHAQTLNWDLSQDVTLDLVQNTIFAGLNLDQVPKFKLKNIYPSKSIYQNIPVRQTNIFEGRRKELEELEEWLSDIQDSRYCLVYGDGGFGKTTLVLEFLNRLVEGDLDEDTQLPSIISYYSSKMTRWTSDGVIHFKGISESMEDGVRELLYCLHDVIGKEWYKHTGNTLIDKVAGEFATQGFKRDDILIVLDNTETLATSPSEVEALSEFIKRVGKKLARVLVTSRRREFLPAIPLQISALSESDAFNLITRLGKEYGATAINQAGDARLKKACKSLTYKPLLIDTFVKYMSRSSSGIDGALDQILKKTNDELLEFLYQDAWLRINELHKKIFLVLVTMICPINGTCVGDVCKEVGVQHIEFQSSLDETYFASLTVYGDGYDLEFVGLARKFFEAQLKKQSSMEADTIKRIATKVEKLANRRNEAAQAYVSDRVADAFRSPYAKAAKVASEKGLINEAKDNYSLALLDEPMNAALHDRYAWFLLHMMQSPDDALHIARKATELDAKSCDAFLTLSLILYRLGNLDEGDKAINSALNNGKPESLCLLQIGISRYYKSKTSIDARVSLALLNEAEKFLARSIVTADRSEAFFNKNTSEARRFLGLISNLRYRINSRTQ